MLSQNTYYHKIHVIIIIHIITKYMLSQRYVITKIVITIAHIITKYVLSQAPRNP